MARYTLTKLLSSTIGFWSPVAICGIKFERADGTRTYAASEMEAESWRAALGEFEDRLFPVLDALAVDCLAPIAAHESDTLIDRADSDAVFLLRTEKQERGGLNAPYSAAEVAEVERVVRALEAEPRLRQAAACFRESLNNGHANEVAVHLLRCVEALAGEKTAPVRCPKCHDTVRCGSCDEVSERRSSDSGELKRILGDDLHAKLWKKPGVRHHLMHGRPLTRGVKQDVAKDADALWAAAAAEFKARLALTEQPAYGRAIPRYLFSQRGVFIERRGPLPSLLELAKFTHQEYLDGKTQACWVGSDRQNALGASY